MMVMALPPHWTQLQVEQYQRQWEMMTGTSSDPDARDHLFHFVFTAGIVMAGAGILCGNAYAVVGGVIILFGFVEWGRRRHRSRKAQSVAARLLGQPATRLRLSRRWAWLHD